MMSSTLNFKIGPIGTRFLTASAMILTCAFVSWSMIANATEGFNKDMSTLPAAVGPAGNAVFMLLFKDAIDYDWGTAFLVEKKAGTDGSQELYFVTNAHVVRAICGGEKNCPALSLLSDGHLEREDEFHLRLHPNRGQVFQDIEVVSLSENPDLALLKVTVPSAEAAPFSPLKVSRTCDLKFGEALYTIGFSDPSVRTASGHLDIVAPNSILKRWSQGIFITEVSLETGAQPRILSGLTIDALPGGSGGPLIDAKGLLVGIMNKSVGSRETNYRYAGNENADEVAAQSFAVSCRSLSEFLNQAFNPQK
jgi:S1-C subfamily serine protease